MERHVLVAIGGMHISASCPELWELPPGVHLSAPLEAWVADEQEVAWKLQTWEKALHACPHLCPPSWRALPGAFPAVEAEDGCVQFRWSSLGGLFLSTPLSRARGWPMLQGQQFNCNLLWGQNRTLLWPHIKAN